MLHDILHMGWPFAAVLIAAIIGLTITLNTEKGE